MIPIWPWTWPCWNCTTSYKFSVSVKKMGEGWTGGASDIVKRRVLEKIPGQLEASFLIFLTFGSIKQSNTPLLEGLCSSNPCRFELSVFAFLLSECLEMGSVVTRNMSHEGGVDCLVLPWVFWAWKCIVRAWKLQKSGPSPRLKIRTWKIRFSCMKAKSDKYGKVESDTSSLSLQNAKNVTGYSLHLI